MSLKALALPLLQSSQLGIADKLKLMHVLHSSLNSCSPCRKIRCTMPHVLLKQPDPTACLTIEKINLGTVFELISDLLLMSDFWWDLRWGSTNYDDLCQNFNLAQNLCNGAHERCALHSCDALQNRFKFENLKSGKLKNWIKMLMYRASRRISQISSWCLITESIDWMVGGGICFSAWNGMLSNLLWNLCSTYRVANSGYIPVTIPSLSCLFPK